MSTNRRTLVLGVGWTVPAILATTAVPAFAASGCPTFTSAFGAVSNSTDPDYLRGYIRFTNASALTLPVGTTITWRVQNLSKDAETVSSFTQPASPAVTVSFSPTTTGSLATNSYVDITVTLGSAWGANAVLEWRYNTVLYSTRELAHRITITVPGCTAYSKCLSVKGTTYRGGNNAVCPPA